jgi:hypothetical protein
MTEVEELIARTQLLELKARYFSYVDGVRLTL